MLSALSFIDEPELQAKLFDNSLEEVYHAAVFSGLARQLSDHPLPYGSAMRRQLYDPASGIVPFEAVHFVGEGDVYNVFLSYAHAAPSALVRDTFLMIRGDEEGHQELAYKELVRLSHSERAARNLIRSARWTRVRQTLARMFDGGCHLALSAVLAVIYFPAALLLGPWLSANIKRAERSAAVA